MVGCRALSTRPSEARVWSWRYLVLAEVSFLQQMSARTPHCTGSRLCRKVPFFRFSHPVFILFCFILFERSYFEEKVFLSFVWMSWQVRLSLEPANQNVSICQLHAILTRTATNLTARFRPTLNVLFGVTLTLTLSAVQCRMRVVMLITPQRCTACPAVPLACCWC